MSKEIEQSVEDYVKSCGISWSVQYCGFRKDSDWHHDAWRFAVIKGQLISDEITFDYKTGTGHRKAIKEDLTPNETFRRAETVAQSRRERIPFWIPAPGGYNRNLKIDKEALAKAKEYIKEPVTPSIAGLIYSCLLDMSACEMSFDEWCKEYGYNNDSRKAFQIYQDCQEIGDKIKKLFDYNQREKLQELLQDY